MRVIAYVSNLTPRASSYFSIASIKPEDAVVDQIVDLDVRGQVDRDPPGHVLDQVQILVNDLFATELNPADHITRSIAECFHGLLP